MQVLYLGRIGIWKCCFLLRDETGEPGEKPSEQGKNQQQTQATYDTGRRGLLPLRHPYPSRNQDEGQLYVYLLSGVRQFEFLITCGAM